VLKIQTNLNILNKPAEEKNAGFLANNHSIENSKYFSNKKNKLDYVSKLISENGRRNSAVKLPKSTGTVKVKYNIT
jgi:hypothetical protein